MNLLNVRRGQFVYYENMLHRVYSVKHFFKRSVHLIRMKDYEQKLTTAREIDLYKPKHLDSFIYNHKRYTLDKNVHAKVGDYILVVRPRPDSIDNYHLHAIEMVSAIEVNGVITNRSNGIKHNEYWVMVDDFLEDATMIDLQNPELDGGMSPDVDVIPPPAPIPETYVPQVGDVYQINQSDPVIQAMVIAIKGETIYFGGNLRVSIDELKNSDRWSYVHNVLRS